MSNLVKRLRDPAFGTETSERNLMNQAADRIERLETALRDVMQEAAAHHKENENRAKLGGSDMAKRKAKAIVARSGVSLHNIRFIARAALEEACSSS